MGKFDLVFISKSKKKVDSWVYIVRFLKSFIEFKELESRIGHYNFNLFNNLFYFVNINETTGKYFLDVKPKIDIEKYIKDPIIIDVDMLIDLPIMNSFVRLKETNELLNVSWIEEIVKLDNGSFNIIYRLDNGGYYFQSDLILYNMF